MLAVISAFDIDIAKLVNLLDENDLKSYLDNNPIVVSNLDNIVEGDEPTVVFELIKSKDDTVMYRSYFVLRKCQGLNRTFIAVSNFSGVTKYAKQDILENKKYLDNPLMILHKHFQEKENVAFTAQVYVVGKDMNIPALNSNRIIQRAFVKLLHYGYSG